MNIRLDNLKNVRVIKVKTVVTSVEINTGRMWGASKVW